MWSAAPTILEGEDEEALKSRFIQLVASYPSHNPYEIAEHVFKDLRDPGLRSQQAAMIWLKDVEVLERIRLYRLNGGDEVRPVKSKEQLILELEVIAENDKTPIKERIAAYAQIARMQGYEIKAVEMTTNDKTERKLPQFTFARYDD